LYCGVTAKVIALFGDFRHGIDNQMYNVPRNKHMENMGDLLVSLGLNRFGYEALHSGITGEPIGDTEMFLLPIQRLNHLCECKVHFRNSGSVDIKSRQPKDGRKNGSGARLSEMELIVFESHGVSIIASQRFCDLSDKFSVYVCAGCSLFCDEVGSDIGFSFCRRCASEKKVRKCKISFMLKVLLDHLLSLGISTEIYVKDSEHMFIKPIS
jgi:DNA-directed RNA polymerase beta subunit